MDFMPQKEVVDRMVAKPSTSDYGRLSVMLQSRFDMERFSSCRPGLFVHHRRWILRLFE
jgi:16S rRNA (adenine1518-N6/adenine1519-N6)-dimethyltransferase